MIDINRYFKFQKVDIKFKILQLILVKLKSRIFFCTYDNNINDNCKYEYEDVKFLFPSMKNSFFIV